MKQKKMKVMRKAQSYFLSVCMLLGMLTGIPVVASEERAKLEVTMDLVWENQEDAGDVPVDVGEDAYYTDDITLYYPEATIAVRYGESIVKAENLKLLDDSGNDITSGQITPLNTDFVKLVFPSTGNYTLQYTPEGGTVTCNICVYMPHVGFYSSEIISGENYVSDFIADGESSFYVGLSNEEGVKTELKDTYENTPDDPYFINRSLIVDLKNGSRISEPSQVKQYLTWEAVEGKTGVYKCTPNKYAATIISGISVQVQVVTEYDTWWETGNISVESAVNRKLFCTWDVCRDEENVTFNEGKSWDDAVDADIWSEDIWGCVGDGTQIVAMKTDAGVAVAADDVTVMDLSGGEDTILSVENQGTDNFLKMNYKAIGSCLIIYKKGTNDEAVIPAYVGLPACGFYLKYEDIDSGKPVSEINLEAGESFYAVMHNESRLNTEGIHASDEEERNNESEWIEYPIVVHTDDGDITNTEELQKYITYEKISGEDAENEIYKFTPNSMIRWMGLEVNSYTTWDENGETRYSTANDYKDINSKAYDGLAWTEPEWTEDSLTIPEDATWHTGEEAIWVGLDYSESYVAIKDEDGNYIKADNISLTDRFGNPTTDITCCDSKYENMLTIMPKKTGEYRLVYTNSKSVKKILPITVDYNEVGFYTTQERSESSIIVDDLYKYGKTTKSFYVSFDAEEKTYQNIDFYTGVYNDERMMEKDAEPCATITKVTDLLYEVTLTIPDEYEGAEKCFGVSYDVTYEWDSRSSSNTKECRLYKKVLTIDNVEWNDDDFTYDGEEKTYTLSKACLDSLPEDVTVSYEGNQKTNAGKYEAKVILNYDENEFYGIEWGKDVKLSHTFTIKKGRLDTGKIAWNYKEAFTYDGKEKSVELTGLPKGLTPAYSGNSATQPGTYTASVTFTYDTNNYEEPDLSKVTSLQWKIVKTETPTTEITTEETFEVSAGDTGTDGTTKYKVLSSGKGEKQVTYTGTTKTGENNVDIPETVEIAGETYQVTEIADNVFKNNKKIKKVTIPKTVKSVGKNAFKGCKNLKQVIIKKQTMVKIADGAFQNCTNLKSITIPKTVKEIGKNAFSGCKNLKSVTIKTTGLKKIGKNAFKGIAKKAVITVPKSSKKSYEKMLKKSGYKGTVK